MSSRAPRSTALLTGLFLFASAITASSALLVAAQRMARHFASLEQRSAPMTAWSDAPIAAEAEVFRTRAGVLAISPTPAPRRSAHPRTLATYRSLRAYPGAPPRVPHGLTPTEFRSGGCNTCHERGGFSRRFDAYVPITPHPEMGQCLQCHVGNAQLMAIALPNTDPSARCRQCHVPGATRWADSTLNWKPMAWPQLTQIARDVDPPPIPHAPQMRGNCLACHSAPSAVAEIRTSHPERADCRQCHVAASSGTEEFQRPSRNAAGSPDGVP